MDVQPRFRATAKGSGGAQTVRVWFLLARLKIGRQYRPHAFQRRGLAAQSVTRDALDGKVHRGGTWQSDQKGAGRRAGKGAMPASTEAQMICRHRHPPKPLRPAW